MKVSIVIPTLNQRAELQRTLRALVPENEECEILVVDRGSTDGTASFLKSLRWVTVLESDGYRSEAINAAVRRGSGEVFLILLPGSVPVRGWYQALCKAAGSDLDAGYFPSAREPGVRSQAEQFSLKLLGGPRSSNGVFVRAKTLNKLGGLRPVPEFEWLAFSRRVKEAGGRVGPLPHEVLIGATPERHHRSSWWADTLEECFAAWKYIRTDSLCPVRARRERSAVVVLRPDWAEGTGLHGGIEEMRPVYEEVAHQLALSLKTFKGVRLVAMAGPKACSAEERDGLVQVVLEDSTPEGRIQELLAWAEREAPEAVYVVRPVFPGLTHEMLRALSEQSDDVDAGILPTSQGEWAAFWMESPASGRLAGWNGGPSASDLNFALKENVSRINTLPPVHGVFNQQDAKAYFYRGVLRSYT